MLIMERLWYGLCFINHYIYIYVYRSNSDFKSVLGKSIPLFVSSDTLDRSPHRDTFLGKLTKNLKKDLKVQVLSNPCTRKNDPLKNPDISTFRHRGYPSASPLVLASPETMIFEITKWQQVDKCQLTDEILSEDLRSVTTVRLEEEMRALNASTLFFYLRE
jgi:hypothetical protein